MEKFVRMVKRVLRIPVKKRQTKETYKPLLEALEDRIVPAPLDFTWTGAQGAAWTSVKNWVLTGTNTIPTRYPGESDPNNNAETKDSVEFTGDIRVVKVTTFTTVVDAANIQVGSVNIDEKYGQANKDNGGGTIRLLKDLTVNRALFFSSTFSSIEGNANLILAAGSNSAWGQGTIQGSGQLLVQAGAALEIRGNLSSTGPSTLAGKRTLVNDGTVEITNAQLVLSDSTALTNQALVTMTLGSSIVPGKTATSTVKFHNRGTLTLKKPIPDTGAEIATIAIPFYYYTGAVDGEDGTKLVLSGGGASDAAFKVSTVFKSVNPSKLSLFEWYSRTTWDRPSSPEIDGAQVYIPKGHTVTVSALTLLSGELRCFGTINVTKRLDWLGGRMEGKGSITVGVTNHLDPKGVTVNIGYNEGVASIGVTLDGMTFNSWGTTNLRGSAQPLNPIVFAIMGGATFNNYEVFNIVDDSNVVGDANSTFFMSSLSSTLQKTGGTGTSQISYKVQDQI